MATMVLETNEVNDYNLIKSAAAAISDMRDKAMRILKEKQDIAEACQHLEMAGVVLDHFCVVIEKIDPSEVSMPVSVETGFRLLEDNLRSEMRTDYSHISSRLQHKLDALSEKMDRFFQLMHNRHYSASEEELGWYYAMRDGRFDEVRYQVLLNELEYRDLLSHLESDEPNTGLDRLYLDTQDLADTIIRH